MINDIERILTALTFTTKIKINMIVKRNLTSKNTYKSKHKINNYIFTTILKMHENVKILKYKS